ncbi:plasmid recombination protein, partial [Lactiplantibacillus plantarum]
VPEYKAMREDLKKAPLQKREIQAELEDARKCLAELKPRDQQEIESKPTFLSKDKVVVRKSDLHDLESRAAVSDIYNQQQNRLKLDNQSLNYQLLEVKDNNYELSKKNE